MQLAAKVSKVAELFDIFANEHSVDTWGTNTTVALVKEYVSAGVFEPVPYDPLAATRDYNHAARIAYLVVNVDTTPIDIDVGCPSLGYFDINLTDGNHRAAAAIIRGDKTINAVVSGEVPYIKHLFVRRSQRYSVM